MKHCRLFIMFELIMGSRVWLGDREQRLSLFGLLSKPKIIIPLGCINIIYVDWNSIKLSHRVYELWNCARNSSFELWVCLFGIMKGLRFWTIWIFTWVWHKKLSCNISCVGQTLIIMWARRAGLTRTNTPAGAQDIFSHCTCTETFIQPGMVLGSLNYP